ncbi:DUF2161 domain-containing phosphodiesterase, partial [Paenibacillus koleovorans]|uniref:DUF2161 domain-containing phosphodiesterase n=1 Tax=Paenibacillus koleovorans TaxID=121608 RepID=UPI000FD7CA6B
MAIQSETELYPPIKTYWESLGYEVKSEVRHCDLVAIRGDEPPVIVELKKSLNLPLLVQGIDRLQQTDTVYLAVEMPSTGRAPHQLRWSDLVRLCRMLGLGLMTVRFYKRRRPAVEVLCDPAPYTPRKSKVKATRLLYEFRERSGDYNVGGSTRRKLVTAYREKALHCAYWLRESGPSSPKRLRELTENAKAQLLLRDNYYGWFVRVERGVYRLTPAGEQALVEHGDIVSRMLAGRGGSYGEAGAAAAAVLEV